MKGFMLSAKNVTRRIKGTVICLFKAISVLSCSTLRINDLCPSWNNHYDYTYGQEPSGLEQLGLYRYRYRFEFS